MAVVISFFRPDFSVGLPVFVIGIAEGDEKMIRGRVESIGVCEWLCLRLFQLLGMGWLLLNVFYRDFGEY